MTLLDASLTNQRISSQLVGAGSASLPAADSACAFVAARRSGEHGDVGGGRSRSAPEGHTPWSPSASRSRMMQPHLRSSLRLVTSARSKLRPLSPPALHHCLAEAVVINFCPAGVSGLGKPDPLRPGSSCFRGARSLMASHAGCTVFGAGRDLRCAAMAGPRLICISALTSCCLRASQDRSRDHL